MATPLSIVLIEDHDAFREVMLHYLLEQGYAAKGIDSAEALENMQGIERIDLYILDVNLPCEDGISLARRLRNFQPEVGIIILTARNAVQDKVQGYEGGADIYLTKPTSVVELNAAIHALTRRLRPKPPADGALSLDLQTLILSGPKNIRINLSSNEATLLAGFVRARGTQLEIWQILELLDKELR
jgi:DNA-binding response OmpR family regulator